MIITIREAKQEDYTDLIKLYTQFVERDAFKTPEDDSFEAVMQGATTYLYVAEDGQKLIGFMLFSTRFVLRYPKHIMQLDELFVEESYRKHGVGRRFMEVLEESAKTLDCYSIYIESSMKREGAHAFYEKLGYNRNGYYFKKMV